MTKRDTDPKPVFEAAANGFTECEKGKDLCFIVAASLSNRRIIFQLFIDQG